MALVANLSGDRLPGSSIKANQPSNDRLVVVQYIEGEKIVTIGARYRAERWFSETYGNDITDSIHRKAVWFESYLTNKSSGPTL